MRTSDLEFEYNERAEGYIYVNEDRLENEIKEILSTGKDVETLIIPEEISRDAYLCLTKKRENILKWYKFKENASVLEVGAGYGELTEYLCGHVGHVTCYERKTERIDVIKMRCKAYDNLDCCCGYLQEQKWSEKFDYIFIHDIFALSRKFFKAEDASTEMLKFLLSYLRPEGKILLLIENRLGLKYFAGAAEEISTQFFWGLKSYDEDERCRTFSKAELNDILEKSGIKKTNWFYPYPNLVYPLEIYTDEIMEKIVYGISKPDYEIISDRYQFFDEQRMFWTLHKEGIENRFVNAFFVECAMDETKKQILFADLENDFLIKGKTEDGFVDENGNVLPDGIRIDAYLAGKIQDVVNCNLGNKNPYISQVYSVFREIYEFLRKDNFSIQDFYYSNEKLVPYVQNNKEHKPASEYQRWKLIYTWYVNNIMFYRNAKRRILLEDLIQIMHISRENIAGYIQNWKEEQEMHYIMPRLSPNMFDFEAEDAKDVKCFKNENLYKASLKSKLEKMWDING